MYKRLIWLPLLFAAFLVLMPLGRVVAQGELALNILPGYYYKEITPGEASTLYLEIRNVGNHAITDIKLTSDIPRDWDVSLKPASIDSLSAGSSQTVDAVVTAPPGIPKGDYTLTIIAEASQTRTANSVVVRVNNTTSIWLWIGVGLAVLVIAVFVLIFLRFGRD